ncbi:hypothetical protein Syun_006233 [Stephania yunnanensis]|uniref:Uncharacterized protein n=1 Tax=Stephania yunnanensis TaxID=152371 RepID=A0AAP0PXC8_9MAGN
MTAYITPRPNPFTNPLFFPSFSAFVTSAYAASPFLDKDLNNFDSDPEEFARTLCKDLDIRDAEVAVIRTLKECSSYLPEYPELALDALSRIYIFSAVAVAIREQLYEIAFQSVASARETRISKKGRQKFEHVSSRL